MKTGIKVAICGLLAFALHTNAYANGALQISAKAGAAFSDGAPAVAKQYLAKNLGLTAGATTAQIQAAVNALPASARIGVVAAINAYANKANISATDVTAKTANLKAAQDAFTSQGQLIEVAANVNQTVKTAGVADKEKVLACGRALDASKLFVSGGPSQGAIDAAIKGGVVSAGNCAENPEQIADVDSKIVFSEMAVCGLDNGITLSTPDEARLPIFAGCLVKANKGKMTEQQATASVQHINEACAWTAQKAAQAQARFLQ